LNAGTAVGHGLDTGQGNGPRGEGAQHDEDRGQPESRLVADAAVDDRVVGGLGVRGVAEADPDEAHAHGEEHGAEEQVGRHGQEHRRRPGSAQAREADEQDADDRHRHPIGRERREGRRDVRGEHRHRYGQGEHIVDEQGRGDDEPGTGAEVLRGHLVVASAGGVGPDIDAIAGDDHEDDDAHGHADPRGHRQGHE
jgi:hypothetical protein